MNKKLTFPELAELLSAASNTSKRMSELFLREFFAVISQSLIEGESVKVKGLGVFKVGEVSSRKSVDVNTGQEIEIAEHKKIVFTPDKSMAEAVNVSFSCFESVVLEDEVTNEMMQEIDAEAGASVAEAASQQTESGDNRISEAVAEPAAEAIVTPPPFDLEAIIDNSEAEEDEMQAAEAETAEEPDDVSEDSGEEPEEEAADAEESDTEAESEPEEPSIEPSEEPVAEPEAEAVPVEEVAAVVEPEAEPVNEAKDEHVVAAAEPKAADASQTDEELEYRDPADYSDEKESWYSQNKFLVGFLVGLTVGVIATVVSIFTIENHEKAVPVVADEIGVEVAETVNSADSASIVAKLAASKQKEAAAQEAKAKAVVTDTVRVGNFLARMAKRHYGNSHFWVYIYEENKAKIKNPNNISPGTVMVIPPAEKYGIDANDAASVAKAKQKEHDLQQ